MARFKLWSLEESAGIDLALGTDAARCGRGSTDIQSCQLVAEGVKMEERIGCQHVRCVSRHAVKWRYCSRVGCRSAHTSCPRPDGRRRVTRNLASKLAAIS